MNFPFIEPASKRFTQQHKSSPATKTHSSASTSQPQSTTSRASTTTSNSNTTNNNSRTPSASTTAAASTQSRSGSSSSTQQQRSKPSAVHVVTTSEEESSSTGNESGHEDFCAVCSKSGKLLLCDSCTLVYHLPCVGLKTVPSGTWNCPKCLRSSKVIKLTARYVKWLYVLRKGGAAKSEGSHRPIDWHYVGQKFSRCRSLWPIYFLTTK